MFSHNLINTKSPLCFLLILASCESGDILVVGNQRLETGLEVVGLAGPEVCGVDGPVALSGLGTVAADIPQSGADIVQPLRGGGGYRKRSGRHGVLVCPLPGVLKESRMQWPYSCESDCHQQRALLQQTAATFEEAQGLSIINNSFFPPSQFHSLPLEQWP